MKEIEDLLTLRERKDYLIKLETKMYNKTKNGKKEIKKQIKWKQG